MKLRYILERIRQLILKFLFMLINILLIKNILFYVFVAIIVQILGMLFFLGIVEGWTFQQGFYISLIFTFLFVFFTWLNIIGTTAENKIQNQIVDMQRRGKHKKVIRYTNKKIKYFSSEDEHNDFIKWLYYYQILSKGVLSNNQDNYGRNETIKQFNKIISFFNHEVNPEVVLQLLLVKLEIQTFMCQEGESIQEEEMHKLILRCKELLKYAVSTHFIKVLFLAYAKLYQRYSNPDYLQEALELYSTSSDDAIALNTLLLEYIRNNNSEHRAIFKKQHIDSLHHTYKKLKTSKQHYYLPTQESNCKVMIAVIAYCLYDLSNDQQESFGQEFISLIDELWEDYKLFKQVEDIMFLRDRAIDMKKEFESLI